MKTIFKIVLSVLVFCFTQLNAQNTKVEVKPLTQEQITELQERITYKVKNFQDYLKDIADESVNRPVRVAQYKTCLKLFIGEGEKYNVWDDALNKSVPEGPVKIQISSIYRPTTSNRKIKSYLWNLIEPTVPKYAKVRIESADAVRVDKIVATKEGKYEAMAYFSQKYIGYDREGNVQYGDITTKKIRVYIDAIVVPKGPDGQDTEIIWDVKFGNIYVESTERL